MDKTEENHTEKESGSLSLEERVALLEQQVALLLRERRRPLGINRPPYSPPHPFSGQGIPNRMN